MASIIDGDEHEDDASSTSGSESGSESELGFKFPIDEFDSDPELDDEDDIENEDIENERGNTEDKEDDEPAGFHDDVYEGEFSDHDDSDEDDGDARHDLQKFEKSMKTDIIATHHPQIIIQNHHEIEELCLVIRDENGVINDPKHRTLPFITKYEKAKLLGERATQINAGATPFVEVDQSIIDGYLIALAEFEQKKIPMIIRRPLPNNQSEYWRLEDLEIL
jgi:DNA-directed RNA polymerase I, II, and III subunit RPABC2